MHQWRPYPYHPKWRPGNWQYIACDFVIDNWAPILSVILHTGSWVFAFWVACRLLQHFAMY